MKLPFTFLMAVSLFLPGCRSHDQRQDQSGTDAIWYNEKHRPQIHFTPKEMWMNDPNGMVYHKGQYHLFYQYYPEDIVWGPMHWGHAVSKDLIHWTHMPISLYPDSLGLIFSGSAVVDKMNTSGFGSRENPPLVAVYTYHSQAKEKSGRTDYQYQGIAYSTDDGQTWNKYEGNPVLENQGIKDFRDPKVFYHEESSNWVMILAVKDHVELWGSENLKEWSKLSDFGSEYGAHGGVWECPDLFPLNVEGESTPKWVMIVSLNPGGPNGGSATQYFVGDFDGTTFTPDTDKSSIKWIDYGPDNYAGVTWSDSPGDRKIFLGWMSNWAYAQELPTRTWRGATTLPRDVALTRVNNDLFVKSSVADELAVIGAEKEELGALRVDKTLAFSGHGFEPANQFILRGTFEVKDFAVEVSNSSDQKIRVGFDSEARRFFIDRSKSGNVTFSKHFPTEIFAQRLTSDEKIEMTMVVDVSSVEVFFDDGLSAMTSLFFPDEPLSKVRIHGTNTMLTDVSLQNLRSIWK